MIEVVLFRKLCSCAFLKLFYIPPMQSLKKKRMKNPLHHNNKVCFYYFSCFCCYHNFLFEVHRKRTSEFFLLNFHWILFRFFPIPWCTWSHISLFSSIYWEKYVQEAFAISLNNFNKVESCTRKKFSMSITCS